MNWSLSRSLVVLCGSLTLALTGCVGAPDESSGLAADESADPTADENAAPMADENADPTVDENAAPTADEPSVRETYVYKGATYSDLESLKEKLGGIDYSAVGVNDDIYVFDTQAEALAFEKGDVPHLLGCACPTASQPKVTFKITFYKDANYGGSSYVLYKTETMDYSYHWYGYGLTNNVFKGGIPGIAGQVSSYKAEYVKAAYIDLGSVTKSLMMNFKLYTGAQQTGQSWSRNLDPYFSMSDSISDLSKHRMWKVLGITNWNDKINSWKVEFF